MNRDEIKELLGNQVTWKTVKKFFKGMSPSKVEEELDKMWPEEPEGNKELAQAIYEELN